MKVRFFNTYEPVTSLYRDLVPYLHELGATVEIVVSKGEYRRGRQPLQDYFKDYPQVKLTRTPNFGRHAYEGTLPKAMIVLTYFISTILYGVFGPKTDKNVFLTQPPFVSLLGYLFSIVRRQPYYCIVMDIQPQMAVSMGLAKADSLLTKLLASLSALSLRKAEGVIVIGRCMAEQVRDFGVAEEKIHLIPNWADEATIYPVAAVDNVVRQAYGWQEKFVVLYAGNIGIPQHFDDILEVTDKLQAHDDLLFVFIGEGARRQVVDEWVETRHLTNVVRLPFLHDKYSLAEILSAGDVHLVTLRDVCTGWAVPSKSYGVLAAGRPLIYQGKANAEVAQMVQEENVGAFVPTGDVALLESVILDYYAHRASAVEQGKQARELATSHYSRESAVKRYGDLLLQEKSP